MQSLIRFWFLLFVSLSLSNTLHALSIVDLKEGTAIYELDEYSDYSSDIAFWWSQNGGNIWIYAENSFTEIASGSDVASSNVDTLSYTSNIKIASKSGSSVILHSKKSGAYFRLTISAVDGALLNADIEIVEEAGDYIYAKNPIDEKCTIFLAQSGAPEGWEECTQKEYAQSDVVLNVFTTMTREYIATLPNGWNLVGTSFESKDADVFEDVERVIKYDSESGSWKVYDFTQVPRAFNNDDIYIKPFEGFWIYK